MELLQDGAAAAARALVELASSSDTPAAARLSAANSILDRVIGKPPAGVLPDWLPPVSNTAIIDDIPDMPIFTADEMAALAAVRNNESAP